MAMDQFLAEYYGTAKTASAPAQEDLEKQASVDLFLKLASEQGIDLTSMQDEQVNELYSNWIKAAAEEPGEKKEHEEHESKKEEKVEEAKKEHEEKKAYAEKVAEADFLGRVMAHSYVQEMRKIASAGTEAAPAEGAEKEAAMPEFLRKGLEAAKHHGGHALEAAKHHGGKAVEHAQHAAHHVAETAKKHPAASHGAAAAAGAALGAGGAHALHAKHKKASAIDELAAERAVYVANEAGFDPEQAGRKVAAILELGLLEESAKVASAPDVDTAVGIRALELLEKAGYPVEWK
jgi:hypothetical protein